MSPNPQFAEDLATFPEYTLIGKIHFLCSAFFQKFLEDLHILIGRIKDFRPWF